MCKRQRICKYRLFLDQSVRASRVASHNNSGELADKGVGYTFFWNGMPTGETKQSNVAHEIKRSSLLRTTRWTTLSYKWLYHHNTSPSESWSTCANNQHIYDQRRTHKKNTFYRKLQALSDSDNHICKSVLGSSLYCCLFVVVVTHIEQNLVVLCWCWLTGSR